MAKKTNILFIVTDDQRFDTIHALGNSAISTPNMDRLVQRGTAFTQAHIPSGICGAVCMPSRAMIHSGRQPFHLEGQGGNIPPEHITLGETLKSFGYETIGLGKWHNGCPGYARSFTQGAKVFFGGMWDHWNVPTCRYDPSGAYDNVVNFVVDFFHSNKTIQQHCDEFNPGKHSSEMLTDAAIEMLKKNAGGEKPFFEYVAYLAPHDPRTMPEEFKNMYRPEDIALPPNFMETIETNYPLMRHRDEQLAAYPRDPEEIKRHIAEYYGMISHLDHEIGRLLDALRDSGEEENTIVVFTGDNGLALGQHGWMGKEDCYEHSIRVPLIFAGPGIPRNRRCEAYVYLLDIYPTLCDLVGAPIPASVDGKSFASLLKGEKAEDRHRDYLYLAFEIWIRGVKDGRYKLIEYVNDDGPGQHFTFLYDLKEDPWEITNLAEKPEYTETLRRMRKLLFSCRDEWEEEKHPFGQDYWRRYRTWGGE